LRVDAKGNLYETAPGGVWVISPEGKHLGTIRAPEQSTNVGFGDADKKTLYNRGAHQHLQDQSKRAGDMTAVAGWRVTMRVPRMVKRNPGAVYWRVFRISKLRGQPCGSSKWELLLFGGLVAGLIGLAEPSVAKVVKFEIIGIESPAFEGRVFGPVGTYDRIIARATIAVAPGDARNSVIVDVDRRRRAMRKGWLKPRPMSKFCADRGCEW